MKNKKNILEVLTLIILLGLFFINLHYVLSLISTKHIIVINLVYDKKVIARFNDIKDCNETIKNIQKYKQRLYSCEKR